MSWPLSHGPPMQAKFVITRSTSSLRSGLQAAPGLGQLLQGLMPEVREGAG